MQWLAPQVTLLLGILCEVVATASLKLSNGLTRPLPSAFVAIGYGVSLYFLSVALKQMPLGVVYALWSGLGTIGAIVAGAFIWNEQLDLWAAVGFALIVTGVVVLQALSKTL